jgi:hypothetical protein
MFWHWGLAWKASCWSGAENLGHPDLTLAAVSVTVRSFKGLLEAPFHTPGV